MAVLGPHREAAWRLWAMLRSLPMTLSDAKSSSEIRVTSNTS